MPPAKTQRYTHTYISLHRWIYTLTHTHAGAIFAYVCDAALCRGAWGGAGDVVGIAVKIFPPGLKQLKLMNEPSSSWTALSLQTVQLFQTSQNAFLSMSSDQYTSLITVWALPGVMGQQSVFSF